MNQIKKLELIGFKSFCDRTHLPFQEGITAIIGPNGCGKSNIADAISWVVGAQSAKALRTGGKMEDVIFNGTEKRKATNYAEVILTLSLDSCVETPGLPDFDRNNFTVGRRLYRSGESEYYLDGHRCRLRDLQTLLEGTGLGPNSYAILEQGRVGQILSSKPAERRSLIEEAARITLYKNRRVSAEAQLERARQNLLRVQDTEQELVRQLNSLRRQAARARAYSNLRENLRAVQKLKICMEDRALREKLAECDSRFRAAGEHEQTLLADLAAAETARDEARGVCADQEETLNCLRERLSALKMEAQSARSTRENQDIQRQNHERRAVELEREREVIAGRGRTIELEIERLIENSRAMDERIANENLAAEAEQARSEKQQESIRQTESRIDEIRSFLARGAGDLADLKNQQARCQEGLRRITERTDRLGRERELKAEENRARAAELDVARRELERQNLRRETVAGEHAELEAEYARRAARIEELSAELSAAEAEHGNMRHRFDSLEEIERRRSNYSEGVQKFLSTRLPGEEECRAKTLADYVDADPAYEAALEDYLNSQLQYIIVDSRDDAVNSVERLRRIGAGKCTFMTLQNGHCSHAPAGEKPRLPFSGGDGVIGYLEDLIRMNNDVRQAFERVLPEYASTVMVNDLDTAFRVAEISGGGSYLTLSGESYSPRGVLSAVGEKKSMAGFLATKREKKELEKKLVLLKGKIEAARVELADLKQRQAAAAEMLKTLAAEVRRLETDIALAGQKISHLERELARIEQAEAAAAAELEQLAEEKAGYEIKLEEAAGRIAEIETRRGAGDEELREMNARLQDLRTQNAAVVKELGALSAACAVSRERKSGMETDIARLRQEAENVRRRDGEIRAESAAAAERISELETARGEIEERIVEYDRTLSEATEELEKRQESFAELRAALGTSEESLKQFHSGREEAMEARGQIEIEKTRFESDLEHLERNCADEFHVPAAELIPDIPDEDWGRNYEDVAQDFNSLREKAENFGPINQRALEDYQETEQQYQFKNGERLDAEKGIADLLNTIADLNQRSSEQFREAYAAIRQNFQDVFQTLFGGGHCDISLLDENDILESGLDITAQPPGKKLQNVQLLSGGEKALTALALLIAIFRYRPSPVCILDEVDAPLDEANVGRFSRMLTEMSCNTQFIIITHNKHTMEAADMFFGVAMEEPGVTKVVSVDFRRHQERLAS
ncbi:MAG: chromosome segregation protein SMC [Acidobacteriota bacterium]|jgi:chromosome segregation protein|nr:chromosome segregation protein SMC [Acidobacteriota bacterium]